MESNLINKIIKKIKIKDEKNKINKNEKLNFLEGSFSEKDFLSPSYINNSNPKYLEIDGIYYSSLLIENYNREQTE